MSTEKLIKQIYPKGLDYEFTNDEKIGYLKAIKDLKNFYQAVVIKELKDLIDDYNKGFIDSADEWQREIIDLHYSLTDKIENNKIGGVSIGDEYKDETIKDGVVIDFIERKYLVKSESIYDSAVVEFTNKYKDYKKNIIEVPIWKVRVYNEKLYNNEKIKENSQQSLENVAKRMQGNNERS